MSRVGGLSKSNGNIHGRLLSASAHREKRERNRKKGKKGEAKKGRNETDVATDRTKKKRGPLYEDPSFVKHQQQVRSNHHQPRFV
jgi:hypothetical protein